MWLGRWCCGIECCLCPWTVSVILWRPAVWATTSCSPPPGSLQWSRCSRWVPQTIRRISYSSIPRVALVRPTSGLSLCICLLLASWTIPWLSLWRCCSMIPYLFRQPATLWAVLLASWVGGRDVVCRRVEAWLGRWRSAHHVSPRGGGWLWSSKSRTGPLWKQLHISCNCPWHTCRPGIWCSWDSRAVGRL